MQIEAHPLPSPYGQLYEAPLYSPYNHEIPSSLAYDLIRLHQEKNVLSVQLADCVTYLKALREKQVKNARQLSTESVITQRKRKKLQQAKRHLDSVIRNRERDEQACLNNLQACETNIILANIKAYHLANALFHAPDPTTAPTLYTPTLSSQSGSEVTDLTWDGWTDEATISPFQKKGSNPFFINDLAPDAGTDGLSRRDSCMVKEAKRAPPLSRGAVELTTSISAPLNTAQSQSMRSSVLSPEAAVFQSAFAQQYVCPGSAFNKLSISSSTATMAKELLHSRRFSAAEISPILQRFSIDVQPEQERLPGQMWCKSTPHRNPQEDAGVQIKRDRTNSL